MCECGNEDRRRKTDELVAVGDAIFRKPGCDVCKRPMQMYKGVNEVPAELEPVAK